MGVLLCGVDARRLPEFVVEKMLGLYVATSWTAARLQRMLHPPEPYRALHA
jgi:hypothetical protein